LAQVRLAGAALVYARTFETLDLRSDKQFP